jgi:hypothetical protein
LLERMETTSCHYISQYSSLPGGSSTDSTDTQKDDAWQACAADMVAAYTKEILSVVPLTAVAQIGPRRKGDRAFQKRRRV